MRIGHPVELVRRTLLRGEGASTVVVNALAVAAFFLAAAGGNHRVSAGLGLATLLLIVAGAPRQWRDAWRSELPAGNYQLARLILVFCGAVLAQRRGGISWVEWTATAAVAMVVLVEPAIRVLVDRGFLTVINLPTFAVRSVPIVRLGSAALASLLATALVLADAAWDFTDWPAFVLAAIALGTAATVGVDALRMFERTKGRRNPLTRALEDYAPEFVLHWDAPGSTAYQVAMWLPYLERIGRRFYVLVRTSVNFEEVRGLTSAPIVLKRNLEELDQIAVPSLKAAFYVNTATRNCHMIRYTYMKHIQLNHGDSDKVPSFNPVFRMFDRNFVAGQAAIDRFSANGVWMPREMFEIVGRPQVSGVEVAADVIGATPAPTVLYAPTWAGFYADSNYCSLLYGAEMISALLARGCTVIFRPHPYTYRSVRHSRAADRIDALLAEDAAATGRQHLFGAAATTERSIFECFNASDALISDVSSVVNDYLYSEKPFAMVAVSAPAEAFADEFPVSRAAYVLDAHTKRLTNLDDTLDDLLKVDPLRDQRRALKHYYLGDFEPEQRFLEVVRSYL